MSDPYREPADVPDDAPSAPAPSCWRRVLDGIVPVLGWVFAWIAVFVGVFVFGVNMGWYPTRAEEDATATREAEAAKAEDAKRYAAAVAWCVENGIVGHVTCRYYTRDANECHVVPKDPRPPIRLVCSAGGCAIWFEH